MEGKSIDGAFGAMVAVLVLSKSAEGEEMIVNGPGNGSDVDPRFEFITGW